MRRLVLFVFCLVATAPSLLSQNNATDSQNLRALLEEVRQLRHDLQTTTVAAQRVQIALYKLELQDAAVSRATKLVEESRSKLADLAAEHRRLTTEMERAEDARKNAQDDHERQAIEQALSVFKVHVEEITGREREWQSKANEAEGQLHVEQLKLDALHTLLDELDQALQNVGRRGGSATSAK